VGPGERVANATPRGGAICSVLDPATVESLYDFVGWQFPPAPLSEVTLRHIDLRHQ